jgi:hypothetical protein
VEEFKLLLYVIVAGATFSVLAFFTTKILNRIFGKRFYAVLDGGKKIYETQKPNETEREAVARLSQKVHEARSRS